MVKEVVDLLAVRAGGTYVDGTLGEGGHARAILDRAGNGVRLVGFDRDGETLARARKTLAPWLSRSIIEQGDFTDMEEIIRCHGIESVDGVLMDLGISSLQLDDRERGFSFMREGPLDMRFDRTSSLTALDLVQSLTREELAEVIGKLGEERFAGRIAREIIEARKRDPAFTTSRLADLIAGIKKRGRSKIHPATQTFQALRMAVNQELDRLQKGLTAGIMVLRKGGRFAVLSYHSLEDRIVKQTFRKHVGCWESQQAGGRRWMGQEPSVRLVNRKPLIPSKEEIESNRRARSAKLRVIERIG